MSSKMRMSPASLATRVPLPMAKPTSARRRAGASLMPVAGHAHHPAHLLGHPHQAALVGGGVLGHHPQPGEKLLDLAVGELVQFSGGEHLAPARRSGPCRDGPGGLRTVSGDHHHLDARTLELAHRTRRFLPEGVPDEGQGQQDGRVAVLSPAQRATTRLPRAASARQACSSASGPGLRPSRGER